jgi:hypothetical protein
MSAAVRVRDIRLGTQLRPDLRARLARYSAARGISERVVIEEALTKHFEGSDDGALLLRRFDRVDEAQARDRRARASLGGLRPVPSLWFLAHAPATEAGALKAAEAQYQWFARHMGAHFSKGHRFSDDFPIEAAAVDQGAR